MAILSGCCLAESGAFIQTIAVQILKSKILKKAAMPCRLHCLALWVPPGITIHTPRPVVFWGQGSCVQCTFNSHKTVGALYTYQQPLFLWPLDQVQHRTKDNWTQFNGRPGSLSSNFAYFCILFTFLLYA